MKIGIIGASGRMGQTLVRGVITHPDCELSGGIERVGNSNIGLDIAKVAGLEPIGLEITTSAEDLIRNSDAIIDFTAPEATLEIAKITARMNKVHVIGTTGFTNEQEAELKEYAKDTTIIWSYNMSVGINILLGLVEKAASILDDSVDIEIVEMHHKHKVDAPSGTAIALGRAAAEGRGVAFDDVKNLSREGIVGERTQGEIGFATLRGGEVIGDHTVMFASGNDRIELTHKASDRSIFASGAIRAALWGKDKSTGLFTMKDVLGL